MWEYGRLHWPAAGRHLPLEVRILTVQMVVRTIDPSLDTRWDDFVTRHPDGTVFHLSAWAQVLRDRYGDNLLYFVVEDEGGRILAGCPFVRIPSLLTGRRLTCLPSSEYCYPLAESHDSLSRLLATAKTAVGRRRVSFLEFRGWGSLGTPEEFGLLSRSYYLRHVARLTDNPLEMRVRLDRRSLRLRRNLRKAEESGLVLREARTRDDLRAFHRLTVVTRRRLNLLPWPYSFLQSIFQHMIAPGHGYLLLAELAGRVIAGSMYLFSQDSTILKFNASDRHYAEHRANFLLTWKAIERACREGYHRFDLGICNPENEGLATFKRYWGTDETLLPYYYYPTMGGFSSLAQSSRVHRLHVSVNRWMTGPMLKLAARVLHRHLG